MLNFIKNNCSDLSDKLAGRKLFWYRSASGMLLYEDINIILKKFCKGRVLDIGAGRLAYKNILLKYCKEYKSVDFKKTSEHLDYISNAQNMKKVIKDNDFNTVFCSQVLEHVPEPQKAINEMYRVLRVNGTAILSVPFLGFLHNEPHDFFRYTKHALVFMGEKAGFEVIEVKESGGLFSFLGYCFSFLLNGIFSKVFLVGRMVLYLNVVLSYLFIFLDKVTGTKNIMPLNYLVIFRKKHEK